MSYICCAECPAASIQFERGWRAFPTDEAEEPAAVVILCPDCAEREFGPYLFRLYEDEA